jgi:hypothetical protein
LTECRKEGKYQIILKFQPIILINLTLRWAKSLNPFHIIIQFIYLFEGTIFYEANDFLDSKNCVERECECKCMCDERANNHNEELTTTKFMLKINNEEKEKINTTWTPKAHSKKKSLD